MNITFKFAELWLFAALKMQIRIGNVSMLFAI